MSKKAKVKSLKLVLPRDVEFFTALSNVGHISREQAFNNLEYQSNNKRIETYIKNGYIERQITITSKGECKETYKFTQGGRDYVKSLDIGINHIYQAQSQYHDQKIADKYFALTPEERNSWRNENELKNDFLNYCQELREQGNVYEADNYLERYQNGEISVPDCCYTSGQEVIIWEAITNTYGEREIQSKREFAQVFNAEIQFSKR